MINQAKSTTLNSISLPLKALFTGYLLVIGVGLLMAGAQIMLTHGMADGKPGLSIDDIVYSYYGHRNNSKLESKLNGSMKDKAPENVRFQLIEWARKGAKAKDWEPSIKGITQQYCVKCHSVVPGIPNFTKLSAFQKVAQVDEGDDYKKLTRISHIHLFGIAFIFFFVGFIFSMAQGFSSRVQAAIIAIPFVFLLVDVSSWWLTKLDPEFAILVIVGGGAYSLASGVMIATSLYQMWVMDWLANRRLK